MSGTQKVPWSLVCRAVGHKWIDMPLRCEQSTAKGLAGWPGRQREVVVPVTWCCDEVCERCGAAAWWPS